jgi:single-stranded DNA-binding protein
MIDALISGKLIRDPALKTGPSGKPYCNFLLSVPTGDGEPVIVSGIAFADVAERIGRLKKGDAVSVAGSLKPSEWTDKTTGELKHGLNITVSAALSAYDVKKRRGNTEGATDRRVPQAPPDYSGYSGYNDPIDF